MGYSKIDHRGFKTFGQSLEVTSDHFGDVYTTFTTIANYLQEGAEYNIGQIRWPGGGLAEGKNHGGTEYALSHSEIYYNPNKTDRGFSDLVELADALDRDLTIIVPTLPTFNAAKSGNEAARHAELDEYRAELDLFLDRLTARDGHYDNAISYLGEGHTLTLEIGNETAHLGWSNNVYDGDWNYGRIAAETLDWAHGAAIDKSSVNIDIAIQAGVNVGGARKIVAEILELQKELGIDLLGQIDQLVSHSGLAFSAEAFDFDREYKMLSVWKNAFDTDGRASSNFSDVSFYATEWSVGDHRFGGNIFTDGLTLKDASAFGSAGGYAQYQSYLEDLGTNDIGARQGAGTIDVFAKLVALGFDAAALWGTVDPALHSNSYQSIWSEGNWNGAADRNDVALSHGGAVLELMADSLPGLELGLGGVLSKGADGAPEWNAAYFDSATKTGAGEVNDYVFSGSENHVIFSTVTDIDGNLNSHSGQLTQTYDISSLSHGRTIMVNSVKTNFDTAAWKEFKNDPGNAEYLSELDHVELMEFRRVFESVDSESSKIVVNADGTFDYTFTSDFETVRFVIEADAEIASRTSISASSLMVECFGTNRAAMNVARRDELARDADADSFAFDFLVNADDNQFDVAEAAVLRHDDSGADTAALDAILGDDLQAMAIVEDVFA